MPLSKFCFDSFALMSAVNEWPSCFDFEALFTSRKDTPNASLRVKGMFTNRISLVEFILITGNGGYLRPKA